MPKLVHSSRFTVHGTQKSVNRQPTTACPDKGRDDRKSKGFTLIELLIVIVIIGVLATIGIYMSMGRVAQARDSIRKADLNQVKKGLELVKSECQNNYWYPITAPSMVSPKTRYYHLTRTDDLVEYLQSSALGYLKKAPLDPKNDNTYYYGYSPDRVNSSEEDSEYVCPGTDGTPNAIFGSKDYRLTATLENKNDPDIAKSQTNCPWILNNFVGLTQYPSPAPYTYVVCPN